jgi:hypothetical protein
MLAAAVRPEATMISLLLLVSSAPGSAGTAHRIDPEADRPMPDRGTGVPCIGLALAASGVFWASSGCLLVFLTL